MQRGILAFKQLFIWGLDPWSPGPVHARARRADRVLPDESGWRAVHASHKTEREMRSAWWDIKQSFLCWSVQGPGVGCWLQQLTHT